MFSLIPREVRFFDLFGQPSQHIIEAAQLLHDLGDHFDDAHAMAHVIKGVERRGDLLTREPSGS